MVMVGLFENSGLLKQLKKKGSVLREPIRTLVLSPRKDFGHFPVGHLYTDIHNYMLMYFDHQPKVLFLS